jgi:hypothetical protein
LSLWNGKNPAAVDFINPSDITACDDCRLGESGSHPKHGVAHRRLADTELPRDLVLGQAATDGLDDLTAVLNRQALLLMATSRRSAVSVKATPWRAIGRSFQVRRRTDVNDRQVVAAT